MLQLVRFDLRDPAEWDIFYNLFSAYLAEVCDEDEYQENIADLHDDTLNGQMIEQTLQEHNPYFVMRIVLDEECVGLISYSYNEKRLLGFINNFYVCPEQRSTGIGSSIYRMVESHLTELGAKQVELIPVGKAQQFYIRNGFTRSRTTADGEQVYFKHIRRIQDDTRN